MEYEKEERIHDAGSLPLSRGNWDSVCRFSYSIPNSISTLWEYPFSWQLCYAFNLLSEPSCFAPMSRVIHSWYIKTVGSWASSNRYSPSRSHSYLPEDEDSRRQLPRRPTLRGSRLKEFEKAVAVAFVLALALVPVVAGEALVAAPSSLSLAQGWIQWTYIKDEWKSKAELHQKEKSLRNLYLSCYNLKQKSEKHD